MATFCCLPSMGSRRGLEDRALLGAGCADPEAATLLVLGERCKAAGEGLLRAALLLLTEAEMPSTESCVRKGRCWRAVSRRASHASSGA